MWYKIRELYLKGFNKSQIAFQLGLHRSTVRRYLKMDEDTLTAKLQHLNPEKPDVPLNKNDAFQKVQKRRVQEKR